MKRSIALLLCLAGGAALFVGCGAGLKGISSGPDCATTIEGTLHSQQKWQGEGPIIVKEQMGKINLWKGTIVERRADGIVFDRERVGVLVDPEAKFYAYDELTALIGDDGTLEFGTIPESLAPKWGLELVLKSQNDSKLGRLTLKMMPDQQFGYCIPPGRYEVTEVYFVSARKGRVAASRFPKMELQMRDRAANYIGDIYVDYPPMENATVFTIEYLPDSGSEAAAAPTGNHTLQYTYRDDFKYKGSGYLKISGLEISE